MHHAYTLNLKLCPMLVKEKFTFQDVPCSWVSLAAEWREQRGEEEDGGEEEGGGEEEDGGEEGGGEEGGGQREEGGGTGGGGQCVQGEYGGPLSSWYMAVRNTRYCLREGIP